jgi:hypothetical protein
MSHIFFHLLINDPSFSQWFLMPFLSFSKSLWIDEPIFGLFLLFCNCLFFYLYHIILLLCFHHRLQIRLSTSQHFSVSLSFFQSSSSLETRSPSVEQAGLLLTVLHLPSPGIIGLCHSNLLFFFLFLFLNCFWYVWIFFPIKFKISIFNFYPQVLIWIYLDLKTNFVGVW